MQKAVGSNPITRSINPQYALYPPIWGCRGPDLVRAPIDRLSDLRQLGILAIVNGSRVVREPPVRPFAFGE